MDVESVLARRILQLANQILRNRNEDLKELEITAEQAVRTPLQNYTLTG